MARSEGTSPGELFSHHSAESQGLAGVSPAGVAGPPSPAAGAKGPRDTWRGEVGAAVRDAAAGGGGLVAASFLLASSSQLGSSSLEPGGATKVACKGMQAEWLATASKVLGL